MMKKLISIAMLSCAVTFASAAVDEKPQRLGPVSVYGALGTSGKNIVSQKTGKPVMLRGMSLFWSDATGTPYYNAEVISWAAENLGIDMFRFAMGIDCYNSDGGGCSAGSEQAIIASYSYKGNKEGKESQLDNMVKAAIANDIYIIVDWHSHRAENEQSMAEDFFGRMAAKYKDVPNIIWEVYNEPVNTGAGTIANYAKAVISKIRGNNAKQLALVGTPSWSQMGSGSCGTVSGDNIGYVFHFYAASHPLSQFKGNIENCNGAVFITEWGTTEASGAGTVSSGNTNEWTSYMDQKGIPNCNWSLRHETVGGKNEASAMFSGSTVLNSKSALNSASYTTSGNLVKSYLTKHKNKSWADSLTAGKHSGSCSFAHVTAGELDGSVTGKVSASCTYTSSDPTVATIEGGTIKINGAGYAVMTGNDNSQSVVMITAVPAQTFTQQPVTCRTGGGGSCSDFTGAASSTKLEYKMKVSKTIEGADVTYESDNPSVVSVAKATCTTSECYTDKGKQVWIATFKSPGTANIHATAKSVSGYRALDTTIVFTFLKRENNVNTKYFKAQTVAKNSTTQVFTLEAHGIPVTYTILPEGYAEQQGVNFVAGNKDATVVIKAEAPGNDEYEAFSNLIAITIGAGSEATYNEAIQILSGFTEGIAPRTRQNLAPSAYMQGSQLMVDVKHSGFVKIQVLDIAGRNVVRNVSRYMNTGMNKVDLSTLPRGLYIVTVKDGSAMQTVRWRNK